VKSPQRPRQCNHSYIPGIVGIPGFGRLTGLRRTAEGLRPISEKVNVVEVPAVLGNVRSRAGPPARLAMRYAGDSPADPHKNQRFGSCRCNSQRTKATGYARKPPGAGRWLRGSTSDGDSRWDGVWFEVNSANGAGQVVEPTGRLHEVRHPPRTPEQHQVVADPGGGIRNLSANDSWLRNNS
jgi:hypothetical protein